MCDKKQTISDNEKFVSKGIIELIPDWETNETLKKNFPKILETAKKTKEWCFNFMTGEIDIFDDADVETDIMICFLQTHFRLINNYHLREYLQEKNLLYLIFKQFKSIKFCKKRKNVKFDVGMNDFLNLSAKAS